MAIFLSKFLALLFFINSVAFAARSHGNHKGRSQVFQLLHSDSSSLEKNIISEKTVFTSLECAHECLAEKQCKAFNFQTRNLQQKLNCQLTNTLEHGFKETGKQGRWRFYQAPPRQQMTTPEACHSVRQKSMLDLFSDSTILSGESSTLANYLSTWVPRQGTWYICWRTSSDGWSADAFHEGCDDRGPTLTIVKVNSYIFGGYTEASWKAPNITGFGLKMAPESFIFSLKNADNLAPFKAPLIDKYHVAAIVTHIENGPRFGFFSDLEISIKLQSKTNFGRSYKAPDGYGYLQPKTLSLLAGSQYFSPSEVEVFYLHA